jgi:hypothetical protein
MSRHISYRVDAFALKTGTTGKPVYKPALDAHADLFCIYGMVGILNWEWIEDVPDRQYGEQRIQELKRERR